ncbi:hypothetical protein GCM10023215_10110 [Pseudonocardia yuanmonensis]|uniref:DUF4333 domain-containing protein n=1 Tax=Pseudonocardia yuanmonensis TaxID=1095914 RepID=A0ABP8W1W9_9PSEU
MSTPRDPHRETDRGHRAAGGQGDTAGPDPSTGGGSAREQGGDVGGEHGADSASRTVPHPGRSGWDFTRTPEADPPTPAYGSPAVEHGDEARPGRIPTHDRPSASGEASGTGSSAWSGDAQRGGSEWSAGGGSGWSSGGQGDGSGWDPEGTAAWAPDDRTAQNWDPEGDRTAAHPAPDGGWDPAGAGLAGAGSATSTLPGDRSRASRRRGRSGGRKTLIAAAAAVVVVLAVLAVTAFWVPGFLVTEEFDQQALQAGVTQILTEDYGLDATAVSCPEGQRVEAGTTFTCSANVDGENVEVPVTVLDDQGTYQVGRV